MTVRSIIACVAISIAATRTNAQSVIQGLVLDSLHNDALVGAVVTASPGNFQGRTDATGHFTISGVTAGQHRISVEHPLLDSLGILVGVAEVSTPPQGTVNVFLSVPSLASVRNTYCSGGSGPFLIGRVLKRSLTTPASAARVLVDWYEVETGNRNAVPLYRYREVRTNDAGYYGVCNLPPDFDASITAEVDSLATPKVPVSSADVVTFAPSLVVPSRSLIITTLTGKVTSEGRPLVGASIEVLGRSGSVETDSAGTFRMPVPAVGTTLVRVRKIGYVSSITSANVAADVETRIDFDITRPVATLEAVVVRARANDVTVRSGFSERARRGFGSYVMQDEIARSRTGCIVDLLRRRSGAIQKGRGCSAKSSTVTAAGSGFGFRGVSSFYILPQPGGEAQGPPKQVSSGGRTILIYVDGYQETPEGGEISLDWLNPKDVAGIEVYPHGTSVAVAIWTQFYSGRDRGIVKPAAFPVMW